MRMCAPKQQLNSRYVEADRDKTIHTCSRWSLRMHSASRYMCQWPCSRCSRTTSLETQFAAVDVPYQRLRARASQGKFECTRRTDNVLKHVLEYKENYQRQREIPERSLWRHIRCLPYMPVTTPYQHQRRHRKGSFAQHIHMFNFTPTPNHTFLPRCTPQACVQGRPQTIQTRRI